MVEKDGAGSPRDGHVRVRVVQDDVGRFAAQFQRDLFQIAGRGLNDDLADFGRAGECDLVHIGMRGQRRSRGLSVTGHDVYHALREARLLNQLAQAQRGKRGLLGGLQD